MALLPVLSAPGESLRRQSAAPALLRMVEMVQPRRVLTTRGWHREFAATVRAIGIEAWPVHGGDRLEMFGEADFNGPCSVLQFRSDWQAGAKAASSPPISSRLPGRGLPERDPSNGFSATLPPALSWHRRKYPGARRTCPSARDKAGTSGAPACRCSRARGPL
jgi:hypothetical protein